MTLECSKSDGGKLDFCCNETEAAFQAKAKAKGLSIRRGGWPDFLLESKGKTFCVEVKSPIDLIRPNQAAMFEMLWKAGLPVYIWRSSQPNTLTPWKMVFSKQRFIKANKRIHNPSHIVEVYEGLRQNFGR